MVDKTKKTDNPLFFICTNVILSIRSKTLLVLLGTFLLFYGGALLLVLLYFPNTFLSFENSAMNQNSRRLNRILKDLADDVLRFAVQYYGAWDVIFIFLIKRMPIMLQLNMSIIEINLFLNHLLMIIGMLQGSTNLRSIS
jgi:hypothetical protein